MVTVLLYLFIFSTWGLGLVSFMVYIAHKLQQWELDYTQKKLMMEKFNQLTSQQSQVGQIPGEIKRTPWGSVSATEPPSKDVLPDKLRELMSSSPNHPEVGEIENGDTIIGVRFQAAEYPPTFGDEDDEE